MSKNIDQALPPLPAKGNFLGEDFPAVVPSPIPWVYSHPLKTPSFALNLAFPP